MKICLLLLFVLSSISYGLHASPKGQVQGVDEIHSSTNYRVKVMYLNGTPEQSATFLENIILEQAKNGWYYDSYVDLENDNFDAKLLIFKKNSNK